MPIYEFQSKDGQVIEEYFGSSAHPRTLVRNGVEYSKLPFPSSLSTFTKLSPAPWCTKTQVLNGYRDAELQGRRSSYTSSQVKAAWADTPIQR